MSVETSVRQPDHVHTAIGVGGRFSEAVQRRIRARSGTPEDRYLAQRELWSAAANRENIRRSMGGSALREPTPDEFQEVVDEATNITREAAGVTTAAEARAAIARVALQARDRLDSLKAAGTPGGEAILSARTRVDRYIEDLHNRGDFTHVIIERAPEIAAASGDNQPTVFDTPQPTYDLGRFGDIFGNGDLGEIPQLELERVLARRRKAIIKAREQLEADEDGEARIATNQERRAQRLDGDSPDELDRRFRSFWVASSHR